MKRAAESLAYGGGMLLSRLRGAPRLLSASLYLTHRCNLSCVYCSSPLRAGRELDTAQWLRVVDELADLGCRRFAILGGEPLLRSDLADIIAHATRRGVACVVTSNGLLVPRRIDWLRGVKTLVLSLDAVGSANDQVRGAGVYESVRAAVAAARAAGIAVKLNTVLSLPTAPGLDALLRFVDDNDLHVTLNVVRSGNASLWRDAVSVKAEDAEIAALLERLADLARRNRRILFSPETYRYAARWGDFSRDRLVVDEVASDDPRLRGAPRCQAGRYFIAVEPDGSLSPCSTTSGELSQGNVVEEGVEAVWRRLHDHPCVACYAPCLVEKNALFSLQPRVVARFFNRHLRRFA